MGMVHSGFYGALFNGDEEQGRLFDDLVGCIRSADEGKAKAIYLTGSRKPTFSACIAQSDVLLLARWFSDGRVQPFVLRATNWDC